MTLVNPCDPGDTRLTYRECVDKVLRFSPTEVLRFWNLAAHAHN
jgi:hypothetical protein